MAKKNKVNTMAKSTMAVASAVGPTVDVVTERASQDFVVKKAGKKFTWSDKWDANTVDFSLEEAGKLTGTTEQSIKAYDLTSKPEALVALANSGGTLTNAKLSKELYDKLEAAWVAATTTVPGETIPDPEAPEGPQIPGPEVVTEPESITLTADIKVTIEEPVTAKPAVGDVVVKVLGGTAIGKGIFDGIHGVLVSDEATLYPSRFEIDASHGITINFDNFDLSTHTVSGTITIQGEHQFDVSLSNVSGGVGVVLTDITLAAALLTQTDLDGTIGMTLDLVEELLPVEHVIPSLVFSERPDSCTHESRVIQPTLNIFWDYLYNASPDAGTSYKEISDKLVMFANQVNKMLELDEPVFSIMYSKFEEIFVEFGDTLLAPQQVGRGIMSVTPTFLRTRLYAILDILNIITSTVEKGKVSLLIDFENLTRLGFNEKQADNIRAYYEQ